MTDEMEIKHKVVFLNNVFAFAGIVAFGMGFVRSRESLVMGMIDFGFAALALVLLYFLRQHKEKVEVISSIALVLSFMLFFAIYLLAPYNTTRSSLFFLLSASAFFLKGRRVGFYWLVFILACIVSVSLLSSIQTAYSAIDSFTLCVYLIALYFIFNRYESIKAEQKARVDQLNLQLEEKIRARTSELQQANLMLQQMNEQLDSKVKERTQQLSDTQEELVRTEKLALLGQVADNMGHELRNPLGVINNAVFYLQTVLADADATTKEYMGIIKDEIGDAERIVSDLLDAVRSKPPQPERVNVAEWIDQTLHKCDIPATVNLSLDMPPTLPPVSVDPMHLHQVLWNLITNAVEAMPQGGTLQIGASEVGGQLRISIKDSGCGMTAEQQAKLFQPMFTTKTRRIGLGLVVVKNLTGANGGKIEVHSETGKGSEFSVIFPAVQ